MSFSILDNANCHWHLFKFWFLVEECINIEFAIKSIKVIFIDLICRQAASTVIPLCISKHIVCIYLSAIGFYLFTSRFLNSKILQIWNYIFIVNNIILYKMVTMWSGYNVSIVLILSYTRNFLCWDAMLVITIFW